MKGLIIKDILNLKKNFKTILLVIVFFAIYAYRANNPGYMISMTVIMFTIMSITSMTYDDTSKWDGYALTMPISRKDVIVSKYILIASLSMLSALVSFIIAYILILPGTNIGINELSLIAYKTFSISIIFISVLLPFVYKFGVEKAQIIYVMIFAISAAIFFVLNKAGLQLPDENQLILLLKISPLMLISILFSSGLFSYGIYKNKDI